MGILLSCGKFLALNSQKNNYLFPFIAVTILFFLWGFFTVLVDALVPRLKEVFELTYFQAGTVQIAWFAAYALLSIPGAFVIQFVGYQRGIVLGLILMACGCALFYPAAESRAFSLFLLALFVVASGITFLQVAANPYIAVLGSPDKGSARLNLAQAFNSFGTAIAPIFATAFLLGDQILTSAEIEALSDVDRLVYYKQEAGQVQPLFLSLGLFAFVMAMTFFFIKLPKIFNTETKLFSGFGKVIAHPVLILGVVAIFLYVGTEVAIGTWLTNYFLDMNLQAVVAEDPVLRSIVEKIATTLKGTSFEELDPKGQVGAFVTFYWSGAMIGRLIGAGLSMIIKPQNVLSFFGLGAIAMILISINSTGTTAMWSILAVGLFNSVMFPTIFSLAIAPLGDFKPQGSGLLCTAIVGGAILPPLTGLVIDNSGFQVAFGILILSYIFIVFYGWFAKKPQKELT